MNKLLFFLGFALLMAGCATQPAPQTPVAAASSGAPHMEVLRGTQTEGQDLVCSTSYPMDSHIPERICITKAQDAARKKAAQQEMQNIHNAPSAGGCSGPVCF
jgi:hypothetical protein